MKPLTKNTRLNSHDKLIFNGLISREFPADVLAELTKSQRDQVIELCRRAFLKGMEHESLLNE